MNALHALLFAVLQGATELFPVSSLGHAVLLRGLAGWNTDVGAPGFLPFLVMLHVGTSIALLTYFRHDWVAIALGAFGLGNPDHTAQARRLVALIVTATIPALILGFFLEKFFRSLFGSASFAAIFLMLNGVLLISGESLRSRHAGHKPLSELSFRDAFLIGCWQCLALIPGFSRSGATMVGGLLRGVDHEASAHFSFLIAIPVIGAATVLEVPKLLHAGAGGATMGLAALAALVAGGTSYLSTALLMRYFRDHDRASLNPFAFYCLALGLAGILLLHAR